MRPAGTGMVLGAALLAMAMHLPGASAEGALAFGTTGDLGKDGFAFGYANDWKTREKAMAEAMKQCYAQSNQAQRAAALCKVVATYRQECFALAFDPEVGKPGVGWALAPDEETAKQRAIAVCEITAGKDRMQFCKVSSFYCDTSDTRE